MAAQSNPPSFGYTWGFADNSRADSVVEISPNINYTVSEAVRILIIFLETFMIIYAYNFGMAKMI